MSGTKVVATDLDSGESEECVITDDYVVICDGRMHLDGIATHANGTVQLTLKRRTS